MKKLILLLVILASCKKENIAPVSQEKEPVKIINKYTIQIVNSGYNHEQEELWFSVNGKKINGMTSPITSGDVVRIYNDPKFYFDMYGDTVYHEATVFVYYDTKEAYHFGGRKIIDQSFVVK